MDDGLSLNFSRTLTQVMSLKQVLDLLRNRVMQLCCWRWWKKYCLLGLVSSLPLNSIFTLIVLHLNGFNLTRLFLVVYDHLSSVKNSYWEGTFQILRLFFPFTPRFHLTLILVYNKLGWRNPISFPLPLLYSEMQWLTGVATLFIDCCSHLKGKSLTLVIHHLLWVCLVEQEYIGPISVCIWTMSWSRGTFLYSFNIAWCSSMLYLRTDSYSYGTEPSSITTAGAEG